MSRLEYLTEDQVRRYREEGFLSVGDVLSAQEVGDLGAVTDRLVEQSRGVTANDGVYDLEPSHSSDAPAIRRIKVPHTVDPVYRSVVDHPRILAIVRDLIGPAVRLGTTKLNMKVAGVGSPVEWHQDIAFYPHTNDDLLAVGVCIDAMTSENGALLVIPGSHKGPLLDHHRDGVFVGSIDGGFDESKAVGLEIPAGGISIHHCRTLHASAQNRSARTRRLLLLELAAGDAWPLTAFPGLDEFNARLLCGEPTLRPRLERVPVIIPEPKPIGAQNIYEIQQSVRLSSKR